MVQESASVVNSTPLGSVSSDPNDPVPVCPSDLLTLKDGSSSSTRMSFIEEDLLAYGRRRWRRVEYLADQFWIRWKRDYLKALQVRRKWRDKRHNFCVGDVVLTNDDGPRNRWPLGVIASVFPSRDGIVRSVSIKTRSGDSEEAVA